MVQNCGVHRGNPFLEIKKLSLFFPHLFFVTKVTFFFHFSAMYWFYYLKLHKYYLRYILHHIRKEKMHQVHFCGLHWLPKYIYIWRCNPFWGALFLRLFKKYIMNPLNPLNPLNCIIHWNAVYLKLHTLRVSIELYNILKCSIFEVTHFKSIHWIV